MSSSGYTKVFWQRLHFLNNAKDLISVMLTLVFVSFSLHLKIKVLHDEGIALSRRLWAFFGSFFCAQFCRGWLEQKVTSISTVMSYKINHIL